MVAVLPLLASDLEQTIDKLDNVVFVNVVVLDLSQHGYLETQARQVRQNCCCWTSWRVLKEIKFTAPLATQYLLQLWKSKSTFPNPFLGISAEAVRKLDSHNLTDLLIPAFHHLSIVALSQNFREHAVFAGEVGGPRWTGFRRSHISHTWLTLSSLHCLSFNKVLFLNCSWCGSHICHHGRQEIFNSYPRFCFHIHMCPIPTTLLQVLTEEKQVIGTKLVSVNLQYEPVQLWALWFIWLLLPLVVSLEYLLLDQLNKQLIVTYNSQNAPTSKKKML